MKYIVIPPPQQLVFEGREVQYTFDMLNAEFVWNAPSWRTNAQSADCFVECYEQLAGKKPGEVAALSDAAFELYAPLATLRGKEIVNRGVVKELMALMRAVLRATSEPPTDK